MGERQSRAASGRPSIGSALHTRVDRYLREHPELGYQNSSELVRELVRRWLQEQDAAPAAKGRPPNGREK